LDNGAQSQGKLSFVLLGRSHRIAITLISSTLL